MSNMEELRAYYYNQGDMLEMVRYQKEMLPIVNFNLWCWSRYCVSILFTQSARFIQMEKVVKKNICEYLFNRSLLRRPDFFSHVL